MPSTLGNDVIANRGNYGRIIGLHGDSLTRGNALGVFEDAVSPSDPLYDFRSPEAMANLALSTNGRSERVAWIGSLDASNIAARVAGTYRTGDLVVCEDAANPSLSLKSYRSLWLNCRFAAISAGIEFAGMTMFDYSILNSSLGDNTDNQFDFIRSDGELRTYNDAIRSALSADPGSFTGRTQILDMDEYINAWRANAFYVDGLEVMNQDGIHMNVWAQLRYTARILEAAGLLRYCEDLDPLQDLAEANVASLQYGSSITGTRARALVDYCFSY